MTIKKTLIITLFAFSSIPTFANSFEVNNEKNRILFIVDASQSMLGRWHSGRKIDIARNLLSVILDSLKNIENLEIGLRVYGHQKGYPPQDCDDSKLEVNFLPAAISSERIINKLKMIRARGTTPIGKSLEEGALDFPDNNSRNIVILITDGKEECNMNPCAVSEMYQRKGIILKPFVIGIGLENDWKNEFDCIGKFFDASNENEFSNILNIVISHIVDNTTLQVNLLDNNYNNTETNINLTFYDSFTNTEKYNYVHTMNQLGNPDTMYIDPIMDYYIVAHTIPEVKSDIFEVVPGKHNIVSLITPQGELEVKMNSKNDYQYIIRKQNNDSTLFVNKINNTKKFLSGTYDIELLTLPRMYFEDVKIEQNTKTTYTIPTPGIANIILPSKGYGGLYLKKTDKIELIYPIEAKKTQHKLTLLPGEYKVIFKSKNAKQYIYTKEENFKIKSGSSQIIKIN